MANLTFGVYQQLIVLPCALLAGAMIGMAMAVRSKANQAERKAVMERQRAHEAHNERAWRANRSLYMR
jgi:hypothetical protein